MTEFDRKVEEASARINRSVANIAGTLEKETAELVTYLNDEVVPAVRTHSSKALRTRLANSPNSQISWKRSARILELPPFQRSAQKRAIVAMPRSVSPDPCADGCRAARRLRA